jgi:hypothetical protein
MFYNGFFSSLLVNIIYRVSYELPLSLFAQRLVAQALGHVRLVAVILAGIQKPHSNVRPESLGQVACSHVLGMFQEYYYARI